MPLTLSVHPGAYLGTTMAYCAGLPLNYQLVPEKFEFQVFSKRFKKFRIFKKAIFLSKKKALLLITVTRISKRPALFSHRFKQEPQFKFYFSEKKHDFCATIKIKKTH